MEKLNVCWISAGVSSFIAGYLAKDNIDAFIYIDISDQHKDSLRFINDCQEKLNKPIHIIKNEEYNSVEEVCLAYRFLKAPRGAPCTNILKKRVRKEWERKHKDYRITYYWGLDSNELERAYRIKESMTNFSHKFPLISHKLEKDDAHGICKEIGVKRPLMYDLGYSNNNCIGCLKGGKGYWNKIRKDFPTVFERRANLERTLGHSILKDVYLDELNPNEGRVNEVFEECSIACQLALE